MNRPLHGGDDWRLLAHTFVYPVQNRRNFGSRGTAMQNNLSSFREYVPVGNGDARELDVVCYLSLDSTVPTWDKAAHDAVMPNPSGRQNADPSTGQNLDAG
jgi:hypothetical protein